MATIAGALPKFRENLEESPSAERDTRLRAARRANVSYLANTARIMGLEVAPHE